MGRFSSDKESEKKLENPIPVGHFFSPASADEAKLSRISQNSFDSDYLKHYLKLCTNMLSSLKYIILACFSR